MGDVSKVLGKPIPFKYGDKTYELSPLTYALQAEFEFYLERRAVEALERRKGDTDADQYEKRYNLLLESVAAGKYSFGSPACVAAVKSLPGLKEIIFISLRARHPEVTRQLVDEIFESHLQEAMATFKAANGDPFAKGRPGEPPDKQ